MQFIEINNVYLEIKNTNIADICNEEWTLDGQSSTSEHLNLKFQERERTTDNHLPSVKVFRVSLGVKNGRTVARY
jgi:hypothetical protein